MKIKCKGGCGSSGIYQGMAEGREEAIICLDCEGHGFVEVETLGPDDRLFTERTIHPNRSAIMRIRLPSKKGGWIGNGPACTPVTYEEFLAGKRPTLLENPPTWRAFDSSGEVT